MERGRNYFPISLNFTVMVDSLARFHPSVKISNFFIKVLFAITDIRKSIRYRDYIDIHTYVYMYIHLDFVNVSRLIFLFCYLLVNTKFVSKM